MSLPITRNGVLLVTTVFFWKFCFSLRTFFKELIWCTNYPNVHTHAFRKRWSFIWQCFLPGSMLKGGQAAPIENILEEKLLSNNEMGFRNIKSKYFHA